MFVISFCSPISILPFLLLEYDFLVNTDQINSKDELSNIRKKKSYGNVDFY